MVSLKTREKYFTSEYTSTMNVAGNAEFKSEVSLFADTIKEGLAPNEASGEISTGGFETGKFGMQLDKDQIR